MIYLHFSFQNMTYLCIFSCHPKSDTAQVTVACEQALHLWRAKQPARKRTRIFFLRAALARLLATPSNGEPACTLKLQQWLFFHRNFEGN